MTSAQRARLDRKFREFWNALNKCKNNPYKGMNTQQVLDKIRSN